METNVSNKAKWGMFGFAIPVMIWTLLPLVPYDHLDDALAGEGVGHAQLGAREQVLAGARASVDRAPRFSAAGLAADEGADVDDPLALLARDPGPVVGVGRVGQVLVLLELRDARVEQVFTEAFHDVAREFEGVFSRLFPGGEGRLVLTDPDDTAGFLTDWTGRYRGAAEAVVRPRTTDEVSRVLTECDRSGIRVCAQGGNTGLVGGSVPPAAAETATA